MMPTDPISKTHEDPSVNTTSQMECRTITVADKTDVETILKNEKNATHLSGYCKQWNLLVKLLINRGIGEKTMHVLTIKETIIGFIIVEWIDRSTREASIEYVIHNTHWGKGYGTEAARLAIEKCRDMDARIAVAMIVMENTASHKIAQKIGFEMEGFHSYEMNGMGRKTTKYTLLLEEDKDTTDKPPTS